MKNAATHPLRAIREKCLDCCSGSAKVVRYCACDGVNSTRCALWPFRFGYRPATARKRYGKQLLSPKLMPGPNVDIALLP